MSNKITATITKTPSNVRVAQATDADGAPVVFASIENVLVVTGHSINPSATAEEARQSGDVITGEVIKSARLEGVSKIWVVAPDSYDGPDVRTIRVVEEKVPQALPTQRIGCYSPVPSVTLFN
jgi:hypothetical protein